MTGAFEARCGIQAVLAVYIRLAKSGSGRPPLLTKIDNRYGAVIGEYATNFLNFSEFHVDVKLKFLLPENPRSPVSIHKQPHAFRLTFTPYSCIFYYLLRNARGSLL